MVLGCRVLGLRGNYQGLGFRVQGLGFRVLGFRGNLSGRAGRPSALSGPRPHRPTKVCRSPAARLRSTRSRLGFRV